MEIQTSSRAWIPLKMSRNHFKEAGEDFRFAIGKPERHVLGLVAGIPNHSVLASLLKTLPLTHRRQLYGINITAFYVENLTTMKSLSYYNSQLRCRNI